MISEVFEFFEIVAEELLSASPVVITSSTLSKQGSSTLLADLRTKLQVTTDSQAIKKAVEELRRHFKGKDAKLPFDYNPSTAKFTSTDGGFLQFVNDMKGIRSIGKHSRLFECTVATRLKDRVTGAIHRVGHPRDKKKKIAEFNKHLLKLGFTKPVLSGKEKDGGLDIIWQLPLGTVPHRPFVSIQCKNASFDPEVANASNGNGSQSLALHDGLQVSVHVPCVFFNDYLEPVCVGRKPLQYVPLGLTDLAKLSKTVTLELI
ncbi:MAG TPA: hypothetical protein VHS31_16125 [Tepidisphaeraceae bacterium]|jgi:hypothetical protein|nr:hypothetical protein [Tepidisphaeraceae bacterium]